MTHVAVFALVFVVLVVSTTTVAVSLTFRSLHRHNQVVPGLRSGAPLSWLRSPRSAARLHRRLAAAVNLAHTGSTHPELLAPLLTELDAHAADIDRRLVLTVQTSRVWRIRALGHLYQEVTEVEGLAVRIAGLIHDWPKPLDAPPAIAIGQRIDALEAALRELAVVDRRR
jgi:hypothetical protein